MDLREIEALGDQYHDHWYYISKGKAMRAFLDERYIPEVLDVGAGSGIFSKATLVGYRSSIVLTESCFAPPTP